MAVGWRRHLRSIAPWAGLTVPPLAWLLCQQGLGYVVYGACGRGGPPLGPAAALGAALICIAAGWTSWRDRDRQPSPARAFIARVGAGAALVFASGCLMIAASTLMIPPCAR